MKLNDILEEQYIIEKDYFLNTQYYKIVFKRGDELTRIILHKDDVDADDDSIRDWVDNNFPPYDKVAIERLTDRPTFGQINTETPIRKFMGQWDDDPNPTLDDRFTTEHPDAPPGGWDQYVAVFANEKGKKRSLPLSDVQDLDTAIKDVPKGFEFQYGFRKQQRRGHRDENGKWVNTRSKRQKLDMDWFNQFRYSGDDRKQYVSA